MGMLLPLLLATTAAFASSGLTAAEETMGVDGLAFKTGDSFVRGVNYVSAT